MNARGEGFRLSPVQLTQEFVRVPSYAAVGEQRLVDVQKQLVAEHLPHGFRTQQLETATPGRPTLLISNSEFPSLVIIAHNDTINAWQQKPGAEFGEGKYDPFSGDIVEEGGKKLVVGRGALDDKSGAATALSALAEYKGRENELPDVMVVLTSDEEGHFAGMNAVTEHFKGLQRVDPTYRPDFVLSLNGNGEELSTACRGVVEIGFTVDGRTTHARKPALGVNAFTGAGDTLKALGKQLAKVPPTELGQVDMNPAGGTGGKVDHNGEIQLVANAVPDRFEGVVDIRPNGGSFPDGSLVNADSILQRLHKLARRRKLGLTTRVHSDLKPWRSSRQDALFLEEIIRNVTGAQEIQHWVPDDHGYDEIGLFMERANENPGERPVAGAIWGLGDSEGFHNHDEAMGVDALNQQAEVVREVLVAPQFKRRTISTPR